MQFKKIKSLQFTHQSETAWVFGKGPGLDSIDMSKVGPLRICINESVNLIDNPTYFFAHDERPIEQVAPHWKSGCCAILQPDRAQFAVDQGIPRDEIYIYEKQQSSLHKSLNHIEAIFENNCLLGVSGTVHSAIHFCYLIEVGSVKLVGFEGTGGYASRLNSELPFMGGNHARIRNDTINLMQILGLDFEFLETNAQIPKVISEHQHFAYQELYDRLRENGYHEKGDKSSHIAKHIPWIKRTLDVQTVLDIGCSTGRSLELFAKEGMTATGVEISAIAASNGQSLGRNVVHGCATNLPFENDSFDLVCSADVFEHLHPDDAERACQEACRVAKKYVFLKIAEFEDVTQQWKEVAGHPLHLTTKPIEWWKPFCEPFGRVIFLERYLICVEIDMRN